MNELSLTQSIFVDSDIKWDEYRLAIYRYFMAFYNNKYEDIKKILRYYYEDKPFRQKSFERMVIQHHDIIEQTLSRLCAGILDKKPTRKLVKGETEWDGLAHVLEVVNFHEKMYESFHKASYVNITQFYPAMREDKIIIDILTPESYLVQASEKDYLAAEKFLLIRIDNLNKQTLVYWDKDTHYLYDSLGDKVAVDGNEEMVNPYEIIPLTELRLKDGTNYFGEPDWNLFLNQLAIDMKLTHMDFTEWFQRGSVLHGVNTKIADGTVISPGDLLQSESKIPNEQVSLNYLNGSVDFESWKQGVDWRISSTLRSKGIVGSSASTDTSVSSGFSKEMDEISLKEKRDRQINKLRDYEKRAFEVLRKVWNYHIEVGDIKDEEMIPVDYEYQVQYVNYEPTLAPAELKTKRDMQKSFYIKDEINFIMEDLGISEEAAIEHLNKIKTRSTELGLAPKQPTQTTGLSLKDRLANATV